MKLRPAVGPAATWPWFSLVIPSAVADPRCVELSPDELKKVQAISKRGSLSVIRNYEIAEKKRW